MKFGSVRFFKVVILCTIALFILIPSVLSVVFSLRCSALSDRIDGLTAELETASRAASDSIVEQRVAPAITQSIGASCPPASSSEPARAASFPYQELYPLLYTVPPAEQSVKEKTAYLTFDDGPSDNTLRILEILKEYDVRATFFVTGHVGEPHPELLKAITDGGHTLGIHSYSHEYRTIYENVEAFLRDYEKMSSIIVDATGTHPSMFRFPGGSINDYNRLIYQPIIAEMTRRGFTYFDWNICSDDIKAHAGVSSITNNILRESVGQTRSIILLHDRSDTDATVAALPPVIEGLAAQGFSFEALTNEVRPINFSY